ALVGSTGAFRPGTDFKDCDACPKMVVIPSGSFMMGSAKGEGNDVEEPRRKVTIAEPFAVSKFEVTFAEWDACVADQGCRHQPDAMKWGRANRPVIDVSWFDAQEYVTWLSQKTGRLYRLLSEAEWEYAARAGTQTIFSWGDKTGNGNANCSRCGGGWDGKSMTAPVGSFAPNAFGLHDMHGNVYEWVMDPWHADYAGAPTDGSAWTEGGNEKLRVLRGGAWFVGPAGTRSAHRNYTGRVKRYSFVGFRVARTLGPVS
ncbi:MAG: formylglycine-generating enzyme family protein, partial [Pseudomonadota bacterium]